MPTRRKQPRWRPSRWAERLPVPDERIVYEARPKVTIAGRKLGAEVFTWAWAFLPDGGGTELTVRVANRGGARLERALDALGTQRIVTKQTRARLARIAAAVEGQAAPRD